MLVAIVVIWAVVIPVALLAISWLAPDRPEAGSEPADESVRAGSKPVTELPRRARGVARLSRITSRRACPEPASDARRRPTSA